MDKSLNIELSDGTVETKIVQIKEKMRFFSWLEKNLTFENAMETLEEIVNQLEAGDIPLNELIDKYNEGMKLSAFCLDELNRAKDAIYAEVDVKDNKIIEKKLDIEGDY